MLKGFYWESHRHGHPDRFPQFGDKRWYEIVQEQAPAVREARFDLIWFPPPSYTGEISVGYKPKEYFNLSNSYGSFAQQRAMLETLLMNGIEPVADIVINHRDGSAYWADFKNPDWGTKTPTGDDEAFTKQASEVSTPLDQRGAPEERPEQYAGHGGITYSYPSFRDIDHAGQAFGKF